MKRPKPAREPRIAVALADVEALRGLPILGALAGKLSTAGPVRVDPDHQEVAALAFACDDLTAALACDAVRAFNRKSRERPAAVWIKRILWFKLPADAVLTVIVGGKPALSPAWFAGESLEGPAPAGGKVEL